MILEAVGKVTNDFGNQGPIVNLLNSVCIFSIERTYFIFSPSLALKQLHVYNARFSSENRTLFPQ